MNKTHDDYVFFTGGYLSNWYPCSVVCPPLPVSGVNVKFNCTEQHMMYAKALVFNDLDTARKIMATNNPSVQKSLGRTVQGFDGGHWLSVCSDIVFEGLLAKFEQNDDCREYLLSTGDKVLVEAAPWDRIWGIGFGVNDSEVCNLEIHKWGKNLLGELLMDVREYIRDN